MEKSGVSHPSSSLSILMTIVEDWRATFHIGGFSPHPDTGQSTQSRYTTSLFFRSLLQPYSIADVTPWMSCNDLDSLDIVATIDPPLPHISHCPRVNSLITANAGPLTMPRQLLESASFVSKF